MSSAVGDDGDGAAPPLTVTVLWATQTGRAKACARRAVRLLRLSLGIGSIGIGGGRAFDDVDFLSLGRRRPQQKQQEEKEEDPAAQPRKRKRRSFLIMFVSTTGDAEQTSSIQRTWSKLLSKSLPRDLFADVEFALFALGDRAYGPDAFCAAGRKLAARLVQLGAAPACPLGYGDDGSPNGGVFADLDVWLEGELFPVVRKRNGVAVGIAEAPSLAVGAGQGEAMMEENLPYDVNVVRSADEVESGGRDEIPEWQKKQFHQYYCSHFKHSRPATAYQYDRKLERTTQQSGIPSNDAPLLGRVIVNKRITAEGWMQNTRHIRIHVGRSMDDERDRPSTPLCENAGENLPYLAGDVATVLPSNPPSLVERFLSVLPPSIRQLADDVLHIKRDILHAGATVNHPWPATCTLRGLLTHCADIQSLPEREDLFALAACCNPNHSEGREQQEKLIALSETAGAALYGDYVIREKRNWADVFYDFDSLRWEGAANDGEKAEGRPPLTASRLLSLLPSIAPRHFSIASSPSLLKSSRTGDETGFDLELCVAVVKGTTPLGRSYAGCCSEYLASIVPKDDASACDVPEFEGFAVVRLWIHPGSFSKLPMNPLKEGRMDATRYFETPVMCVGAGTGIAPLRSLILEREARRLSNLGNATASPSNGCVTTAGSEDNVLVFGCRKRSKDYYYGDEWEKMSDSKRLRLVRAFSRDQAHKLYVQRALREADRGELIARHILEEGGAVYVAGGSKMARAVKDEIVEALGARLDRGERDAKRLLNKLKRIGLFSIEAWS